MAAGASCFCGQSAGIRAKGSTCWPSTAGPASGTPGNGLGAIARLASVFDIYSRPGAGTALFARVAAMPTPGRDNGLELGAVNVSYPGETECGDSWAVWRADGRLQVLIADGLGHGRW